MNRYRTLSALVALTLLCLTACRASLSPDQTTAEPHPLPTQTIPQSAGSLPIPLPPQTAPETTILPDTTSQPQTDPSQTDLPQTQPPIPPPPSFTPTEEYPAEYAYREDHFASLFYGTVLPVTERAEQSYLDSIVFLGDSTTYGLSYYDILPASQVWVPANGTLTLYNVTSAEIYLAEEDREVPFTEAIADKQPEILVVTLGVNGVSRLGEREFKQEYLEIIEAVRSLSPSTIVIPQTIFPIRPEYQYQQSINNRKISQANLWIAELAVEQGLPFLNTAEILLNEHGYLKKGYDSGDGMHLRPEVYEKIVEYVMTHQVPVVELPGIG